MNHSSDSVSPAAFTRRVLVVIALAALAAAFWALSDILLMAFGSVLVALALRSIADFVASWIRVPEQWTLAIVGLLIVLLIAGAAFILGPAIAGQLQGLFHQLPGALSKVAQQLQLGSLMDLLKGSSPVSSLGNLLARMFTWSTTLLGAMGSVLLIVFGAIYIAANPQLYRTGLLKLVPPAYRQNIEATLDDAAGALRLWLKGQLIAMLLVGLLTGLGLWLVGVPSPFALGLIAGLAEFVPIVGPVAAAIPALLMAATHDWQTTLWALAVLVAVQQVESHLIAPLIAGRMASVAPAVGLFAVVSMGVLFGPLGLLFGYPLAVVGDVAVRRLYALDALGEGVEIMGKPARPSRKPGT